MELPKESKVYKGFSVDVNITLISGMKYVGCYDFSEKEWYVAGINISIPNSDIESWKSLTRKQRKVFDWKAV